jgi:aspartyl-tRNA(Asn)/glutamyl-tRNA(Gln) amidotransferase subunit A
MTRLRDLAIASFEASLPENEVAIVPTTPIRAPLLSAVQDDVAFHETNGLVLRNPRIANLLDCPSLSLPLPIEGLPAGLMLIGRRNSDRLLLGIAARLELILNRGA